MVRGRVSEEQAWDVLFTAVANLLADDCLDIRSLPMKRHVGGSRAPWCRFYPIPLYADDDQYLRVGHHFFHRRIGAGSIYFSADPTFVMHDEMAGDEILVVWSCIAMSIGIPRRPFARRSGTR